LTLPPAKHPSPSRSPESGISWQAFAEFTQSDLGWSSVFKLVDLVC
jgi:hypothetical protein